MVEVLNQILAMRGAPKMLICDNVLTWRSKVLESDGGVRRPPACHRPASSTGWAKRLPPAEGGRGL